MMILMTTTASIALESENISNNSEKDLVIIISSQQYTYREVFIEGRLNASHHCDKEKESEELHRCYFSLIDSAYKQIHATRR